MDGVVSVGVDESTSYTIMDDWGGGELGLAAWDDICLAFLPRRLGRLLMSMFLDKGFLFSPATGESGLGSQDDSLHPQLPSPYSPSLLTFLKQETQSNMLGINQQVSQNV